MTEYNYEHLVKRALAKHLYNQARPWNDNADTILAERTGMTINDGTFESICNAWLASNDPKTVERVFTCIYPASFLGFILAALEYMPDEDDDQESDDPQPPSYAPDKIYTVIQTKQDDGAILFVKNFHTRENAMQCIDQSCNNIVECAHMDGENIEIHESHDKNRKTINIWDGHNLKTFTWRLYTDEIWE